MRSYTIKDYRSKRPITVREYTRNGHKGVEFSFKVFVRKATIITLSAVIIASSYVCTYFAGSLNAPTRVEAQTVTQVVPDTTIPPVLKRIEMAESHGNQYCNDDAIARKLCKPAAKGTVLMRANTNKSVDVGEYQLNNNAWGAKAVSLGYDITTPKGNEAMALWIYQNVGTGPWYSSSNNW